MSEKIWFRVLISVFLLAALISAGLWVYNMGIMQGATVNIDGELPTAFADRYLPQYGAMVPYAHGGMRMHSPFRFIGGFFFLLFILAMFRLVIFGPRRFAHYHGRHCGGHWRGWNREDVPPMVEEWHRKMHGEESPKSED